MSATPRPPDAPGPSLATRIAAIRPFRRRPASGIAAPADRWMPIALVAPPIVTVVVAAIMAAQADRTARRIAVAPVRAIDARADALSRPTVSATLAALAARLPPGDTLHAVDLTGPRLVIEVETPDPAALRAALAATRLRTTAEMPGDTGIRVRLETAR